MIKKLGLGALVGGLLTAALTAVFYLVAQLTGAPFVPYDLFNWITRVLPGDLVTFGIDLMIDGMRMLGLSVVDLAKTAERVSAVLQFMTIGIVAGAVFFAVGGWLKRRLQVAGVALGAFLGLLMAGIAWAIAVANPPTVFGLLWVVIAFVAWGWFVSFTYGRLLAEPVMVEETPAATVEKVDRRKFLIQLGASTAVITVAGAGVGTALARAERRRLAQASQTTIAGEGGETAVSDLPNAGDPVQPVPGTRPEYTPIEDHYQVFLQTEPTVIEEESWILPITGLVENPLMLTLDDFRNNYESRDQYVTLTCISGRVGTGLISTTKWTGVSVQDVLEDLGVQDEAQYLIISSGDGFYETVDLDLIRSDRRIMFCYAWDDRLLPVDHGFPLRIWIPDRYGMKQPKWITNIEVTDTYEDGYWVERNWDKEAIVKATSVVDTVAVDHIIDEGGQKRVPVGGIAYAGARGISTVEVRVDGGPWQEAELRTPLSETTWVIWRYEWPFEAGEHLFEVRCVDDNGTPQIEEPTDARPDGSAGIHSLEGTIPSS